MNTEINIDTISTKGPIRFDASVNVIPPETDPDLPAFTVLRLAVNDTVFSMYLPENRAPQARVIAEAFLALNAVETGNG